MQLVIEFIIPSVLLLNFVTLCSSVLRLHFPNFNASLAVINNITAKTALKFGNEAWVLKKREEKSLEAAQIKFMIHLLGITKLDKEKNQCIREKTGAQNIVKEIKQYQEK
jgi:hypothetical protein